MIEKILSEYTKKLSSGDVSELLKAPVYAMIITYMQTENVSEEYMNSVKEKQNSLDYLYSVFAKYRRTDYEDVKQAIDFDQLMPTDEDILSIKLNNAD